MKTASFHTRVSFRKNRRGVTLMELLIATTIMIGVTVPLMYSMIFVLRAQASIAAQSKARLEAQIAMNRMINDIQRTSSELYNTDTWPRLKTVNNGTQVIRELYLFDAVRGHQILWDYNEQTENLRRTVTDVRDGSNVTSLVFQVHFANLQWDEVTFQEYETVSESSGDLTDAGVTAITVRARVFPSLSPRHTVYREFDANGDGDYEDDATGELTFGLTNSGDDPGWQYVVNISAGFRNG